ncbi:MAG: pyruvate, water dikinase regulatory protein [Dermabacter sp.]|nr:pyruvate, water dikinase regulatory protein [Dermabacter sp.]
MTSSPARAASDAADATAHERRRPVPVYFLSDSTGITAEAMGNAMLVQFPHLTFERRTIPFLTSPDAAREVVEEINARVEAGDHPLVFSTAVNDEIRAVVLTSSAEVIDLFGLHLQRVEKALDSTGVRHTAQLHSLRDTQRYNSRMQAIEFAIEHDDGQSLRALDRADIILVAPSRCGKTPTSMYLALQHGLFVANYPLVDEDFESTRLPRPIAHLRERLFGIVTNAERLSAVRGERRPDSRYSSLQQVSFELRSAEAMFRTHRIPSVNSSAKSVEEMSAIILQHLARVGRRQPGSGASRPSMQATANPAMHTSARGGG